MSYTVVGSLRSPFTRIVRLFMITNDISFDFRVLNYLMVEADAKALANESPINKIPFLIDGSQKIFETRVITNHLTKKHGLKSLTLDEENMISSVFSLLDTTVNLFLLKRDGFDLAKPTWYLQRQLDRLPANIDFLTPWMSQTSAWALPEICFYSYLYWASNIQMLDLAAYPECARFVERHKNARGVTETDFVTR